MYISAAAMYSDGLEACIYLLQSKRCLTDPVFLVQNQMLIFCDKLTIDFYCPSTINHNIKLAKCQVCMLTDLRENVRRKNQSHSQLHINRPQVNADQHQATAWLPHFSTLHTHKPTRSICTKTITRLLYYKQYNSQP